jgi:predicted SprT family Zn-dependent metalloprotease
MNRSKRRGGLYRTKQRKRASTKNKNKIEPTPQSYTPLHRAAVLFNDQLFDGTLPPCLVTLQRSRRAFGFFAGRRFKSTKGALVIDEIALNPEHFAERGAKKVMSTLGHELTHQWQHHFGKPSRSGYHNKEWAEKMRSIGLIPSDTGRRGGKPTGQQMTHYIEKGGRFDRAADELIAKGFVLAFVERNSKAPNSVALKKRLSKTRYSCPACELNAWAKPNVHLVCGACNVSLV